MMKVIFLIFLVALVGCSAEISEEETKELIKKLQTKEIKPEFGNPLHIKAAKLGTVEEHPPEAKKKRYKVSVMWYCTETVTVDAWDEDEAIELAEEEADGVSFMEDNQFEGCEIISEKEL